MSMNGVRSAAEALGITGAEKVQKFGAGLIHDSWLVETDSGGWLIQRLNAAVFPRPEAMAENAAAAAARIDSALHLLGDDDPRHRLVFMDGPGGRPWYRDDAGDVWRASVQVSRSRPPNAARPEEVRSAAWALGRFPGLVADGVGTEPRAIIPGFHDTPARLAAFRELAEGAVSPRREACDSECGRLLALAGIAQRLPVEGGLMRWVHNDAKLDNVLVDDATGEALCVVDLDTVMPGLAAHDFGDLVRTAVSGCREDEPDLDRITVREETFRDLAAGYLDGSTGWLTPWDRSRLIDGALVLTYEQALRFLTDYLAGDRYYPVGDPEHNLRRARAQLRLLEVILRLEGDLRSIVDKL